jgi:transcriptional regulator with XRE-family HTH domain
MGKSRYATVYDLETVQGRLHYARAARKLSRTAVAKAFGTRPGTLQNWECGVNETRSVPLDYVKFACVAFEVPMAWVLGETHELPLPPPEKPSLHEYIYSHLAISPTTLMRRRIKAYGWNRLTRPQKGRAPVAASSAQGSQSPLGSTDETPAL